MLLWCGVNAQLFIFSNAVLGDSFSLFFFLMNPGPTGSKQGWSSATSDVVKGQFYGALDFRHHRNYLFSGGPSMGPNP